MNIKEAFRYQTAIMNWLTAANNSITLKDRGLLVKKHHLRNAAYSEAQDLEEIVEPDVEFFENGDMLRFLLFLLDEREKLSLAIAEAKRSLPFDMDVETSINKERRNVCTHIYYMLGNKPYKRKETGRAYRFNEAGEQVAYCYDVEVEAVDRYDREAAKEYMQNLLTLADDWSSKIETAQVTTQVDYTPPFNPNDSFEDAAAAFLKQ